MDPKYLIQNDIKQLLISNNLLDTDVEIEIYFDPRYSDCKSAFITKFYIDNDDLKMECSLYGEYEHDNEILTLSDLDRFALDDLYIEVQKLIKGK